MVILPGRVHGCSYIYRSNDCPISVTCEAFLGRPLLLYTSNHSSSLRYLSTVDRPCPELLCCPVLRIILAACTAIDGLQRMRSVNAWKLACPHPVSLVGPVSAFSEDVSHCLAAEATLASVGVGLVDGMEVSAQADLACAHLCDDRADRSVCANMCGEHPFSSPYTSLRALCRVWPLPRTAPTRLTSLAVVDFVVAIRILTILVPAMVPGVLVLGLWPAASLAALSATSLIQEFFESL